MFNGIIHRGEYVERLLIEKLVLDTAIENEAIED